MLSAPADPTVCSLLEAFADIPDARCASVRRHPIPILLGFCVIALLSGRQNIAQIHRFGLDHPEVLDALGAKRPKRPPVQTTLSDVLGTVRVSDLQIAITKWFASMFRSARGRRASAQCLSDRCATDHLAGGSG